MAKHNPNDRQTIIGLRMSIEEALQSLYTERDSGNSGRDIAWAVSVLEAALLNTDPQVLDKDCGCG